MKRWLVERLEDACVIEHWLLHRGNRVSRALAHVWWDWLDVPPCLLASWSCRLDERWKTGVWKTPNEA